MEYNRVPQNEQNRLECQFEQIIGHSPALKSALLEVEQVAPTDSTVLFCGETGTGKELIAHAIHNLSARCGRPFVKLNCAAIPFDLLESELFGHEKGAFTGAVTQKIGRFEMADKGTLFLDEIGDIPLALQPKLLRVLQEKEFERLGSGRTHRIDVRLVAATHRDLNEMVARNEFRRDLYYRLNVFPILLPPLRERRQDIPVLVTLRQDLFSAHGQADSADTAGNARGVYFVFVAWQRAGTAEPDRASGHQVQWSPSESFASSRKQSGDAFPSRVHLLTRRRPNPAGVAGVGWVVAGPGGAAARLGLKRTTLIAKMKKLGISRPVPISNDGQFGEDENSGLAV